MTEKSDPPEDEKPDADEVFAATLRNLVNTPHQPHSPSRPPARLEPKPPKTSPPKA